jgi:hypothetical protein
MFTEEVGDAENVEIFTPRRRKSRSSLSLKPCSDCGIDTPLGKRGRFCPGCRFKPENRKAVDRKVYKSNETIERKFREEFVPYEPGCTERFARELRWPLEQVRRYAREIGVSKPVPAWSEAETRIVEKFAGKRKAKWIASHINAIVKGAHRCQSQVENKLRRMGLQVAVEHAGYSAAQLAECFGVCGHTVEGWIQRGLLAAERSAVKNGMRYPWIVRENDIVAFIFEHRREFVLRKVDQTWFLDLIQHHLRQRVDEQPAGRIGPKRAPSHREADDEEDEWLRA